MSSNDSNEPGNAAAFQVGDRVYISDYRSGRQGTVVEPGAQVLHGYTWVRVQPDDSQQGHEYRSDALTLISRAPTPASAPAGYSSDDALYECPNPGCEMVTVTPVVRASDGALCCPECKARVYDATPAPAPAQTFMPGQRVAILPSDGTTGRVVSLPAKMTPKTGYPVALDDTGQVIVFSAEELRPYSPHPDDEPVTPAPAATAGVDTHTLAATILANADRAQQLEATLRYDWSELPEPYALVGQLSEQVADLAALYRYLAADVARYLNDRP